MTAVCPILHDALSLWAGPPRVESGSTTRPGAPREPEVERPIIAYFGVRRRLAEVGERPVARAVGDKDDSVVADQTSGSSRD